MWLYQLEDCRSAKERPSHFLSWGKSLVSSEHLQEGCLAPESISGHIFNSSPQKANNLKWHSFSHFKYLNGIGCFLFLLKLYKGKALGVSRCLVSGNADVNHIPTFREYSLNPAMCHILGQQLLKTYQKKIDLLSSANFFFTMGPIKVFFLIFHQIRVNSGNLRFKLLLLPRKQSGCQCLLVHHRWDTDVALCSPQGWPKQR